MFLLVVLLFLIVPHQAWACACCSIDGHYSIVLSKRSSFQMDILTQLRFGSTATLFQTEAGPEFDAKGLSDPADTYTFKG
jgi:hypothetical protein